MPSDLIAYIVLASIFIVTGLRMFVEKPGKPTELWFFQSKQEVMDEQGLPKSFET